ncbi:MAG: hypothetical protein KIT62_17350 [Cyclobacteriaceae bacterium]|nr:hypothetical protein [Cyclobacteriaceae bacterium]
MDIETIAIVAVGLITILLAVHQNSSAKKKDVDLKDLNNQLLEQSKVLTETQKLLLRKNDEIILVQNEVNQRSNEMLGTQSNLIKVQEELAQTQRSLRKIAHSQNLKFNWESRFEELKNQLNAPISGGMNWRYERQDSIIPTKFLIKIDKTIHMMYTDPQYQKDLLEYRLGNLHSLDYYQNKEYVNILIQVHRESYLGVKQLERIRHFLLDISRVEMLEEDKQHFKTRIRDELLKEYFWFITQLEYTNFLIPRISTFSAPKIDIVYVPFPEIILKQDYEYFREQLRPDIPQGMY